MNGSSVVLGFMRSGDGLFWQIDLNFSFGIVFYAVKEFCQEVLDDYYWENEVIELIVFVDVSKKGADDHSESVSSDGPCSMFTTRT